ncbi:DUF3592 domain-containing protein [Streptomyces cavernae]|uniref:DUF3592 domain-containing protein n=1 Tax=Streptomyces cavernae TaxID=2259034 RepID=UPI000FEBB8C5|nr:DUF3592 domain-containing protein [Streptomyces cavernae]
MEQPWLTFALIFAAFWFGMGVHVTRLALRARRAVRRLGVRGVRTNGEVVRGPRQEGTTVHQPEIRYQAPPIDQPGAPATQTYRRAPLNPEQHPLKPGVPVTLRYDPRDPRRAVVIHTNSGAPGTVSYSATAGLIWGVSFLLFGLGIGALSFL